LSSSAKQIEFGLVQFELIIPLRSLSFAGKHVRLKSQAHYAGAATRANIYEQKTDCGFCGVLIQKATKTLFSKTDMVIIVIPFRGLNLSLRSAWPGQPLRDH
jgi:hypothetical protein